MRYITAEAPRNPIQIAFRAFTRADSVKYAPCPCSPTVPGLAEGLPRPGGQVELCIVELRFVGIDPEVAAP